MNLDDYDWKLWIPPDDLPDTGSKVFFSGQIWAWRIGDDYEVDLIGCGPSSIGGQRFESTILAGRSGLEKVSSIWCSSPAARCAILVADVGCAPTDPDLLYQAFYK